MSRNLNRTEHYILTRFKNGVKVGEVRCESIATLTQQRQAWETEDDQTTHTQVVAVMLPEQIEQEIPAEEYLCQ